MNFQRTIVPGIVIADQPTEADLRALKSQGYSAVINLRNDGEPEQPIGTDAEGDLVRSLGMSYAHMGVGSAPLLESKVDEVCKLIADRGEGSVLVHCRKGGRAAAVVLIQQAQANGWSPAEAATKGRDLGLEVDGNLRVMVENYLDDHRKVE